MWWGMRISLRSLQMKMLIIWESCVVLCASLQIWNEDVEHPRLLFCAFPIVFVYFAFSWWDLCRWEIVVLCIFNDCSGCFLLLQPAPGCKGENNWTQTSLYLPLLLLLHIMHSIALNCFALHYFVFKGGFSQIKRFECSYSLFPFTSKKKASQCFVSDFWDSNRIPSLLACCFGWASVTNLAGKPKFGENWRKVSSPWTDPGSLFVPLMKRTQLNCKW